MVSGALPRGGRRGERHVHLSDLSSRNSRGAQSLPQDSWIWVNTILMARVPPCLKQMTTRLNGFVTSRLSVRQNVNLHILSNEYLACHRSSFFARSVLAYMETMSPSRRGFISHVTFVFVTASKARTNCSTDTPCPVPRLYVWRRHFQSGHTHEGERYDKRSDDDEDSSDG